MDYTNVLYHRAVIPTAMMYSCDVVIRVLTATRENNTLAWAPGSIWGPAYSVRLEPGPATGARNLLLRRVQRRRLLLPYRKVGHSHWRSKMSFIILLNVII